MVVVYNSSFIRIQKTLESILGQDDIYFEVIVADDGSEDNHKDEIEAIFIEHQFINYKLVINETNRGIVANHKSGLDVAEGKYIKGISPGDCLHSNRTLRNWVDFLEKSKLEWSFSEASYYNSKNGRIISVCANPQDLKPYIRKNINKQRWNYIVLKDIALGAAIISTAEVQRKYCEIIWARGIRYAEDNIWRLMMFDGVTAAYYPVETILYEYGSGISTSSNEVWNKRLQMDWKKADQIMRETENPDHFQKKMIKHMAYNKNLFQRLFTKGKLKFWIKMKIRKRMTKC